MILELHLSPDKHFELTRFAHPFVALMYSQRGAVSVFALLLPKPVSQILLKSPLYVQQEAG